MNAFEISEIKPFMAALFSGDAFNSFELVEADVTMGVSYHVDGRYNRSFYDTEELDKLTEYIPWNQARDAVFSMIKGKRLPVSLKLVLRLNDEQTEKVMQSGNLGSDTKGITSLLLNVRYENGGLKLVSGLARKDFTMDRTAEAGWDHVSEQFIKKRLNY